MNKKYYLIVDEIQKGPFTVEELKDFNLKKDDLVWFEELEDWTPLAKIEELSSLVKKVPPPIKTNVVLPPPIKKEVDKIEKKSFLAQNKWYVLGGIGLVILLMIAILTQNEDSVKEQPESSSTTNSNSSFVDSTSNFKTFEVEEKKELTPNELREQLLNKEQSNPLKYLTVSGSLTENKVKIQNGTMFRSSKWKKDGYILEGYIGNSASIASFKDVKIRVSFLSNTGSVIEQLDLIIYEYVPSTDGIVYKEKVYAPDGFSNYEVSIVDAKY